MKYVLKLSLALCNAIRYKKNQLYLFLEAYSIDFLGYSLTDNIFLRAKNS